MNSQATAPKAATGEVKSAQSANAAKNKALGTWAANQPDTAYVAVVTYDEHGNISLDVHPAAGNQDLVWHNENIGHVDPANLPKSQYDTSDFGNAIEPHVVKYVGEYLGQFFQVKSPHQRGQTW